MSDLYFLLMFFFFFNDTATTEIYTLSLHDALPISQRNLVRPACPLGSFPDCVVRSEEHTSELQSPYVISYAVFCLKKKNNTYTTISHKHHSGPLRNPLRAITL